MKQIDEGMYRPTDRDCEMARRLVSASWDVIARALAAYREAGRKDGLAQAREEQEAANALHRSFRW